MNVLFVSANSRNEYIDVEREHRTLQSLFNCSGHSLQVLPAAELADIRDALKPGPGSRRYDVLHFSGHATEQEGLHLRGSGRKTDFLSCEQLKELLKSSGIRLAVINTCESHTLAEALSEIVPAAIGTTRPIRDVAARKFTRDFYAALKEKGSVKQSLEGALARQKPAHTPGYLCSGDEVILR